MARIKIYSDITTNKIFFEGSRVSNKDIGEVEAIAKVDESNRIVVKSTRLFKRGSTTEYRTYFKRLKYTRVENEAGQQLSAAPFNYTRDQVVDYMNEQFAKPTVPEYFEYNPTTDRLEAKKAIETTLSSLFLGGQHRMSSGAANLYFEDLTKKVNYHPVMGGLKDQSDVANQAAGAGQEMPKARIFDDYGVIGLGGNPVADTAIAYDGDNFFPFNISGVGITTRLGENVPADVFFRYELSVDGTKVYEQFLTHNGMSINDELDWFFSHPLDIEAGSTNHASIMKVKTINNQDVDQGYLLVSEGDDTTNGTRYQTSVKRRFFNDKEIAYVDDIQSIISGSTYKGTYNADTDTPVLPTGSDSLGDFYRVSVPDANGIYEVGDILVYNGTTYDHIQEENATQTDIKVSALKQYDWYAKAGYVGVNDGSILYPFASVEAAVSAAQEGDSIYVDGTFNITSEIVLDKGVNIYGSDGSIIQYASYDAANGDIFSFDGIDYSKSFKFINITFKNAGGYGLLIKKALSVTIEQCTFTNNGWNGTGLNTVLSSAQSGVLGYDSAQADLQAFYAGPNASNGGAMRIEGAPVLRVIGNSVSNNLRGIRIQDCGINGAGFVTRNVSSNNIESGIYIAAGSLGGSQNITTTMNFSAYNANNGLLCIGGLNNKFSQNEVNGNWNAGFCAWGAGNTTLRDCGLYDNNRSQYNGIGNVGDAKASIQINEAYNLLGTQISVNPAFRFIAEILDTQVHYTGLGSNSDKVGFLITSAVGQLADNEKNIIKIDDVGFIGQDYAIDLSEVDVTNLRLSFGDNSYQSIGQSAVKAPLAGNYSELPFSNHVMAVPVVDVEVDTLKQSISLRDGVQGSVINVYAINELKSNVVGNTIQIIQKNSDKIQLRGLTYGNIYINGVIAGNDLNSANDSLNAAFEMDLVNYKSFLVSEVGINGDSSSGGSLPAIANNWYISYGGQAGTQITTATIGNAYRNYNPFYNGEALEKGHEFIWTLNPTVSFMIGIWGAAEQTQSGSGALQASNWSQGFFYYGATGQAGEKRWKQPESSGVTIEQSGNFAGMYGMANGQVAIRFGQDGYLYLYEVDGGYNLIGRSNSTIAGTSVMIQWASYNEGSFPVMTERTESWEIVHDFDNSEDGEWSDGIEQATVIRSRVSVSPGEKVTLNFSYFGRAETIGFGYSGAATGVSNGHLFTDSRFRYGGTEELNDYGDWTWNTSAVYYNAGNGPQIHYKNFADANNNLGLISFRYMDDNSLELWHETNNELIATKTVDLDGSAFNIYLGANEDMTSDRIPELIKYDMSAEEVGASLTGWYYIQSPDGEFYYPLFATEAEANYIDSVEGGSGTSHTHTFADDNYNGGPSTWYMPDTSGVHAGTSAPQGGIFGNSINVVWNEIPTDDDSNYLPTFNNITYNVQEGSAINIQYKAQGMTDTFNVTNVPNGYADNGYAIIGTAEDITNGYGQSVTHVLNVTRANNFGSVQGTITINVKADLAGNEFTLVDDNGAIKFTQDGGITVLDFNTVTFNAGSTYKFYLDGSTLQTNDIVNMVDANGNGILGNDGLTQMGAGAGYAGAHFQYAIPSDVEPGKFIKFTDGATSTVYADVPLTIAGSTYSATVTGIDLEGPSANQTNTNWADSQSQGWISIDEQLGAGQRLVFSDTFFNELYTELNPGDQVYFGLKSSSWSNTASPFTAGFQGGIYIRAWRVTNGNRFMQIKKAGDSDTPAISINPITLTTNAFIDIASSGDNVRMGIVVNDSNMDVNTTTYEDWNISDKNETGDQSYGITNLDVVAYAVTSSTGTEGIDADNIDWTQLTEISVPVAPTMETNWTKALDFSGGNEHALKVSNFSGTNPLLMDSVSQVLAGPSTPGNTANASNARPWATAIVFKYDGNSSNQHIWNSGEGGGSTDDNIYLRLDASGNLYFGWGRSGAQNECKFLYLGTGTNTTHWHGIYIAHNGTRLNGSDATAANLAAAFDIRWMTSNDNPAFTNDYGNRSTEANWTAGSTGARMDRAFTGDLTIGGRGSNRNFHGKVASMVVTTLRLGVAMPTDAEIKLMITDPLKWEDDYRVGQTVRRSQGASDVTYANSSLYNGHGGTQIWLMGDGFFDSITNGIRNQVYPADQNYGKLTLNSMVSSDIENVSIPGLS